MPNLCNVKQQYSKEDFSKIALDWMFAEGNEILEQEFFEDLSNQYAESTANAIKQAIKNGTFTEDWDMKPAESPSPVQAQFNVNGAKNSESVEDEILAYYLNKENNLEARDRMATRFFDDVISRVLYNKETKSYLDPTTDSVNDALYNYKVELLQSLWEYTGVSHESELSAIDLTTVISRTISDFLSKNKSTKVDKYYDDYVILKNFNKLLKDYTPFIKVNSAFINTDYQAKDMYVWDPSGSYRQSWTDSEDSDISKTVSPLIRLLADYFTTEQGVPIGFKMYNIAMSTVAIWIHENSRIDTDAKEVNKDLRLNGLGADFGKMIDVYIAKAKPNEGLRQILVGIKNNIFNKTTSLPLKIRQGFANQFFLTAKYAYVAYRQNYENGDKHVRGQFLEDSFIDIKTTSLMKRVRDNVWMYQKHPKLFKDFKETHGITAYCEDGHVLLRFDGRYTTNGNGFTIRVVKNGDSIDFQKNSDLAKFVDNQQMINLVQDLLNEIIPEDYDDILVGMSVSAPVMAQFFDTFVHPVGILLAASQEGIEKGTEDSDIFKYTENGDLVDWNFRNFFSQSGAFESIKDGINELNVLKNGEGNNLPVYNLASAVFDTFTIIDELYDSGDLAEGKSQTSMKLENIVSKNTDHSLAKRYFNRVCGENVFIKERGLLKKMLIRSDVKIGNKVKSSDKLTVAEVASLAIFNDFYQNLTMVNDPRRPSELAGNIVLQPITYSDKKSHFLPLIDLSKLLLKVGGTDVDARTVFRNIVKSNISREERKKNITAVEDKMIHCRGDKVRKQIFNQYLRFNKVFGNDDNYNKITFKLKNGQIVSGETAKSILTKGTKADIRSFAKFNEDVGFKYIAGILDRLNLFENPLSIIRAMFKSEGALLSEDADFLQLKDGTLQANETLYFNYKVFNSKDKSKLNKYLSIEKKLFALDLIENDMYMDTFDHPELKDYTKTFIKDGDYKVTDWYDDLSGIMKVARFFRNGEEIFPTQADIESDSFRHDSTVSVELNPMIEGYFYANALFGNQINDIELGGTEGYSPKAKKAINFLEQDDVKVDDILFRQIMPIMASRLANEFKRATVEGANKRKFAQGLQFGVSSKIRSAIVEDEEPKISTLRGETSGQVAQDGAGLVSPLLHRMQNESLVDSPVGTVKKTIAGWMDPRTGTQNHFKWAETTITMDMRQRSDIAERKYKKMHAKYVITDKFKSINDFDMYYNPSKDAKVYEIQKHKLTRTDYLYRYDIDSGNYYRLDRLKREGNELKAAWTLVDEHGVETRIPGVQSKTVISTEINTLYDIDSALGGRFTYELNDGQMVTSEGVHDIIYNITCTSDMKEDFVGYLVNHSAAKAGAINVNDPSVFDNDDEELNTFYISSFGIGVQMDADQEMDFESVTEMGQMISLLTQGGYNVELVNQAYEDIGRVAAEAMRKILAAVDTDDASIYRIIGKALLDTFDSGTKEELGLAQAFIRNAQNAILKETGKDNIILPYSAESIRGSFIAAVTSLINKTGIRRKYAGFGAVQVPAEGIMQYYTIDGVHYNYVKMRNKIRRTLQENGITWDQANSQVLINGKLNPFIKQINQKDIEWEDTIIIESKTTGAFSEPIKITDGHLFDKYRNLIDPNYVNVYRWETKPKELTQSDLRIKISEATDIGYEIQHTMSEFDTDYVRAAFYIDELIDYKKNPNKQAWLENNSRKIDVISAAIQDSDLSLKDGSIIATIGNLENFSINFLTNLKKLCIAKGQAYFNELSLIKKSGKPGRLPVQMSTINDNVEFKIDGIDRRNVIQMVSPEIQNITARVILGRNNFKQFLLRRGDQISDIKEQGWSFFYKRLQDKTGVIDKVRSQVNPERYDGVLHLGNGDNLLILVGDQSGNLKHFNEKTHDIIVSDRAVSYKGKELFDNDKLEGLCTINDLSFYSHIAKDGQTLNVIHVPNYEVFDRIRQSESVTSSQYNYNGVNFLDILKHKYTDKFDEDGNLKEAFDIKGVRISNNTINDTSAKDVELWDLLNGTEHDSRRSRLEQRAKIMYRDFMKQLHYIQTRIPAQAMQSTMNIEVIDFADTDTNYIWVPKMLMMLQGSDLDIDKAYCMGYDVNDAGYISTLSDLSKSDKYDIDDVLLLPQIGENSIYAYTNVNAESAEFHELTDVTAKIDELFNEGASDFEILKYLVGLAKTATDNNRAIHIVYNSSIEERIDKFNDIMRDVITHSKSKRSDKEKEHALRNQVLAAARRIMNDPASQLNAYTPIAMSEPRAAAELNTALGSKEKEMTLDNPGSIFIMQKQNMSGKEVIAMTATGIKSYFIVTTYFNTLANNLNKLLRQYIDNPSQELGNEIVSILNEITFDGKLDGKEHPVLRTFANINFYETKKLLSELVQKTDSGIIYYNTEYQENQANTAFKNYAANGVLNLEAIINDLDRNANGNNWIIKDSTVSDIAIDLSKLLDETISVEEVTAMLSDRELFEQFISKYDAEKQQSIAEIIYGAYEYFAINAPDSLSALLSAATDNAKELILDKLNATSKFADIYITLLAQGVPFINIAKMMTNSAFRIVAKYSQDNVFDPSTSFFGVDSALKFVLNEGQLSCIQRGLFEAFLTDTVKQDLSSVNSHRHSGFYSQIIENIKVDGTEISLPLLIWDELLKTVPEDEIYSTLVKSYPILNNVERKIKSPKQALNLILSGNGNNSWKNAIAKAILDLFNDTSHFVVTKNGNVPLGDHLINQLLSSLKIGIMKYGTSSAPSRNFDYDDNYDDTPEPSPEDFLNNEDDFNELEETRWVKTSKWFNESIRKKELLQLYRYAIKYFIPKTQSWNSLSENDKEKAKSDFKLLSDEVLYAAREMKMLGRFGSINQGLRPKDFDEYKFIKGINQFINRAYINRGKGEITEEFDLVRFITETEPTEDDIRKKRKSYHDRQIEYYDKIKSSINILKAIDYTGNFKEMFKYITTNRNIIENSVTIKLERRLEDQLLRSTQRTNTGDENGISYASTIVLGDKDFRTLSQYCRDLLVLNFFAGRHDLSITIPAGEAYYRTDNTVKKYPDLDKYGLTRSKSITLDNVTDLATFKHLMDWYIIPRLKSDLRFKDNAFIKNLILDKVIDEKSKKGIVSYKVSVPLININDSPKAKQMYGRVLSDFDKLLYYPIGAMETLDENGEIVKSDYGIGDWTIGNLFYIYNLLVNKDRIGGNAFTRLFEDLISSGNNNSLASQYYQYISDLDKGEINIFNEDGTINTNVFIMNLNDLKYRLSGSENASKFAVKETKSGRAVTKVEVFEKEDSTISDEEIEISNIEEYISDFILNLPFSTKTKLPIKPHEDYSKDFNAKEIVIASSRTVFDGLANELANTYGKQIPMEIMTKEEIQSEFGDREDIDTLIASKGFIIDGNIYLNVDKLSLDAPMHEIMHFIAASMKFSDDPEIRKSYYSLLDWITNWLNNSGDEKDQELKKELLDKTGAYGNRHMSDIKEEILVTLLGREFQKTFNSLWGESRLISKDRIHAVIKMVIGKMLNSNEIQDLDFNHLGNATLLSVLKKFASHILNVDSGLSRVLSQNQELAELKNILVKNNLITLSEDCL